MLRWTSGKLTSPSSRLHALRSESAQRNLLFVLSHVFFECSHNYIGFRSLVNGADECQRPGFRRQCTIILKPLAIRSSVARMGWFPKIGGRLSREDFSLDCAVDCASGKRASEADGPVCSGFWSNLWRHQ